jgi:hypothetical protein
MEAARTSETSINFYRPNGAITQNTVIFMLATVRTLNLTLSFFPSVHGTLLFMPFCN